MSVQQIKGRTTDSQEAFDCNVYSSNSLIFTDAVEGAIEEYSLELHLGAGWSDCYSPENRGLNKIDDMISIGGRASIVVEVLEEMRIPYNRYGILLPTGSMFLGRGLLIAPAKVEPAFIGKLKIRLFNTTNRRVKLRIGDKLGTVVFFQTESTKLHKNIYKLSEVSATPLSIFSRFLRWGRTNPQVWITWIVSAVTGSMAAFLIGYVLYYKPMLEATKKVEDMQKVQKDLLERQERDADPRKRDNATIGARSDHN